MDACARLSGQNVPHLGFAARSGAFHGQFVVGVNLNREVAGGVDDFYQQGEVGVVAFGHCRAEQTGAVFTAEISEFLSFEGAFIDDALVARDG